MRPHTALVLAFCVVLTICIDDGLSTVEVEWLEDETSPTPSDNDEDWEVTSIMLTFRFRGLCVTLEKQGFRVSPVSEPSTTAHTHEVLLVSQ